MEYYNTKRRYWKDRIHKPYLLWAIISKGRTGGLTDVSTFSGTPHIKGCEAYNKFKKAREELKTSVIKAYRATRSTYGAPRLTRELHEQGINISQATVGRLMSDLSIQRIKGRTKITTTRSDRYKKVSRPEYKGTSSQQGQMLFGLVTWHISRLKKDGYIWYVSWMPF